MLYLFAGDDFSKKVLNYEKFFKDVPPGSESFFISRNNFDPAQIESFYSGATLFAPKCLVIFQDILEHPEARDFLLEKLLQLGESANLFVFLEGKLGKPALDAFKKARAEVNVFELPKEKKEKYDNFLVANAFASKDKLGAWLHFRKMVDLGVSLEEAAGVLFWKIKDLLLKKNFSKFSEQQLKNFSGRLAVLLPEAREQGLDAEAALEKFILEAF